MLLVAIYFNDRSPWLLSYLTAYLVIRYPDKSLSLAQVNCDLPSSSLFTRNRCDGEQMKVGVGLADGRRGEGHFRQLLILILPPVVRETVTKRGKYVPACVSMSPLARFVRLKHEQQELGTRKSNFL